MAPVRPPQNWGGPAIAAAYAVDEVKDIRDKARAIEMYARQAQNTEAERQAGEIRLRAERRCGQLLAERIMALPRGSNQHQDVSHDPTHPHTMTLTEMGISRDQSIRSTRNSNLRNSMATSSQHGN
jgi:hypothetical protein